MTLEQNSNVTAPHNIPICFKCVQGRRPMPAMGFHPARWKVSTACHLLSHSCSRCLALLIPVICRAQGSCYKMHTHRCPGRALRGHIRALLPLNIQALQTCYKPRSCAFLFSHFPKHHTSMKTLNIFSKSWHPMPDFNCQFNC